MSYNQKDNASKSNMAHSVKGEEARASRESDELNSSLKNLRNENLELRKKIWKLTYRSTWPFGIGLAGAGGISLLLAYTTSSSILTLTGLGLILWGVLLLYVSPIRYVPDKIGNSISLSMIKSIDSFVSKMGYKGRTIFLHPGSLKALNLGYVFIPYEASGSQPRLPNKDQLAEERTFYEDPKGILLAAPGYGLVKVFEEELNINFAMVDLTYVRDNLPKVLNEDLRIVDSISIVERADLIEAIVIGESAANTCRTVSLVTETGTHLGCPMCSALALIISKVTGKPVAIEKTVIDRYSNTIKTTYRKLEIQ